MSVPITLIVDDGAPVNLMYGHEVGVGHELLVPNAFTREFAGVCRQHGVRGKFSVVPMPLALGRIDERLSRVRPPQLRGFLDIVRRHIAPTFDITPEILTHFRAMDLATGRFLHLFEDEWVARAGVSDMTDYISLALRILRNVELPATGVTSPWATGRGNEKAYAQAIADAFWRVHRRKFCWYFLHSLGNRPPRRPWIGWQDKRSGRVAVTVPANTPDVFWDAQYPPSRRAARAAAIKGVDSLLSSNGRGGRVRELFDEGFPIVLLTHWQSLFSNGRAAGLWGLARLLERIDETFADDVTWVRCSDLARQALRKQEHSSARCPRA